MTVPEQELTSSGEEESIGSSDIDPTPKSSTTTEVESDFSKGNADEGMRGSPAAANGIPTHPWKIVLDNGSQVNIVHPRFLVDFKRSCRKSSGLQGEAALTEMCGLFPGFFYCLVSDSVLLQADVEDTHPVTYVPGVSYTVHMGDREVVFCQKNKLYIGDFTDWVREEYRDDEEALSGMTIAKREHLYTRKERRKAIKAGEFIRNAGYP